ncbi:MAG: hypothetical protein GTO40_03975 [Deltaproteobacteria bacterium]|nr:hypothetical protein [Deltaproteobacteria bacterium]
MSQSADLYYQGVIIKLFPRNNMGVVRTQSGREVTFSYSFVIITGAGNTTNDLKLGQKVGYDLGWTGSGLKVTKIKIYPDPIPQEPQNDLEGQGS